MLVDGYVRVSQVRGRHGHSFISPAVQREQIEGWAKLRGAYVITVFEELDESGARADRPLLEQAIRRIEDGASEGLVVARLDRFGRSLIDSLAAIERIQRAGGTFVAVADGFDLTTDIGRFTAKIMLSLAELELDRIRSNWDSARSRAVARGVHLAPRPPTGYRRLPSGRLRPDPHDGPVLTDVFRRRADGQSIASLCRVLEQAGVITPYGNPGWRYTSLRGVLRNRAYLGEVRHGEHVNESAHPALTDAVTWQRAQSPRERGSPRARMVSLLGGLVRCAGCSMAMSAQSRDAAGGRRLSQYVCGRHFAGGACPEPASIAASQLEPHVEDRLFELLAARGAPRTAATPAAEAKLRTAQAAMAAYRDSPRLHATLGEERFAAGLGTRVAAVERALLAVAAAQAHEGISDIPPVAELERQWPMMTFSARRDILGQALDAVYVARGRRQVESRVWLCAAGTGPPMPRRGDKRTPLRRFAVPQANAEDTGSVRPWPRGRLLNGLRDFTDGRGVWPTQAAFEDAGRGRLYAQVILQGGERWWADQLGLRLPPGHRDRPWWTEQRVRASLEIYLAGKNHWPTKAEFDADGMGALRAAACRTGGVGRWTAELRIDRPHRHAGRPGYWTDERIAAELTGLCEGRTQFPSRGELRQSGLTGMLNAMHRRQGLDWWARQVGLERQRQDRRPTATHVPPAGRSGH